MDREKNRIILITRRTRYEELLARYHTAAQARFYVEHLGADFGDYEDEHQRIAASIETVERRLEPIARVQRLERAFLPNFLFGPDDVIVAVGQDGLVANVLKYAGARAVIGVNPDPSRIDGRLVRFESSAVAEVAAAALARRARLKPVTLAQATLADGQTLLAVNDLFIGCRTHASARYEIALGATRERQSSSGVIVSTGVGSTGWLRSVLTGAAAVEGAEGERQQALRTQGLPWDARELVYSVREPFPSRASAASLVFGAIGADAALTITSQMPEDGVIFSDGIERDALEFAAGLTARIAIAPTQGMLAH